MYTPSYFPTLEEREMWPSFGWKQPVNKDKDSDDEDDNGWKLLLCVFCGCHYFNRNGVCPSHGHGEDDKD